MENIPHGITIESWTADTWAAEGKKTYSLHTWRDLHLIPVCQPIVQPPPEKTLTMDVEGRSGEADLSHGLTGYPVFKDREGSWQFWLDTDSYQEETGYYGPVGGRAYREITDKLVALMRSPYQTRIILDDEPAFYYIGRVWLDGKPGYQYDHAKFTLNYRLYPYKYLRNEYGGDWLWDTFRFTTDFTDARSTGSGMWNWDSFCFETDLATPRMTNVSLKAGQTGRFPLVFTDKPSAVFVTSSGKATATMGDQNGEGYRLTRKYTYQTVYHLKETAKYRKTLVHIPFRTHDRKLTLDRVIFDCDMAAAGTHTLKLALYRKGNDVAIASGSCKGKTDADGTVSSAHITNARVSLKAVLEPDTTYVLTLSSASPFYPCCVKDEMYLMKNEYFDMLLSEDSIDLSSWTGYPTLCGMFDFYSGQGGVLKACTRTNIGTVGRNVGDNGVTVIVKAVEDTVVDVEYCPAYL